MDDSGQRLNRRAFVAGALSTATVGVLAGAEGSKPATGQSRAAPPQIIGQVEAYVSSTVVDVRADDGELVRVVLAPAARVERGGAPATLRDFRVGDGFLAVGGIPTKGRFASAARVIPAAFGAEQPPRP